MSKSKITLKKRQYHTKEFKLSAVNMVLNEQIEATEVAARIGIDVLALRRWVALQKNKDTNKSQESLKELIVSNRKLEEEVRRLKMEREILKKAMAYFIPSQS